MDPCGKEWHLTSAGAEARMRRIIALGKTCWPEALNTYYCGRCEGWHVGHSFVRGQYLSICTGEMKQSLDTDFTREQFAFMTQMNEQYVYVFIRQDLPIEQHAIQSLHALDQMHYNFRPEPCCANVVYIGVQDLDELKKAEAQLKKYQFPHYCWNEPDFDFGFTAIATAPLQAHERRPLLHWKKYKFDGVIGKPFSGETHSPVANTSVVQGQDSRL